MKVTFSFSLEVPNNIKVARYQRCPELGPKLLFFSGGTALKSFSKKLISYTHNSIHLITPFDSGGSSAKLRNTFNMLAVGDLRNRLMALADQSILGTSDIYKLFAMRYSQKQSLPVLRQKLMSMVEGKHSTIKKISSPMRKIICHNLKSFTDSMPEDFDLRGANIGNLILAGGYLHYHQIDPVIFLFSKLVEAKGIVRPITEESLHIAAHLDNKKTIYGQHLITGKETSPIASPIKELFLIKSIKEPQKIKTSIHPRVEKLIQEAELICYPMGSFYTSIIANLLVQGVAKTIATNHCPKVFILNSSNDPEQLGMNILDLVTTLIHYLQKDFPQPVPIDKLLNFIILDSKNEPNLDATKIHEIEKMGIQVIDVDLKSNFNKPFWDEQKLIKVLLSLV